MNKPGSDANPELLAAYERYAADQRLINVKVGALLVVTLMPAGSLLDYFVYPDELGPFFVMRVICSLIAVGIWGLLFTSLGRHSSRYMGIVVPLLPVVFIACMIAMKEGFASPYYAGLNLVLLAIGAVLHWTVLESIVACLLVMSIYVGAGLIQGTMPMTGVLVNNFYFISLMDVIVVVGTWFAEKQRFREFSLRFELDANKKQLEESNQKLKELDQIKGRFFANISHELRTPLTLMISPLETIMARHAAALGPATTSLLQTMHGNGLRLLKLINDLLDLVRLDSGVLVARRDPVALDEFLRNMASAARQVAEDKKIDLVVTIAPDVGVAMLDRDKLEKIILNLQFNALKFTPSGGRVELRADKEGEELVLRVSDTGIGIPEKDMPKVFGRFFQVDSSAQRKFQGVGIGLALVKELVELHDGTVKVESVEGKGTTFTARMPFIAPAPGAVPAPVEKLEALPAPAAAAAAPSASDDAASPTAPNAGSNAAAPEPASAGGTVSSQEWLSNLYHRANLFGAPVVDKSAASNGKVVQPVSSGHAATVLIADDQPDMLAFLKSELISQYNVIPVTDGQQAVDNAAAHLPDIILLDMMMPEKDGMQACREIRAAEATRSTPIILITAHVDEDTKLNALRAGASDFLPKPFSTTELQVRVQNLVKLYKSQRKLSEQNQTLEHTIDQLKETESQLVQTEKIVALGRLSAGIIHEINNPLNFAATGLYTLRSKAKLIPEESRDDYAEVLKDVEEGIHRVKSIVSDLRTFTHPGARGIEEVNAQEAVSSALRFLSQEWKNKVEVKIDLPDAQVIWADRNKIIQVLINLLQNSLDAIQSKQFTGAKPSILISGRVGGDSSVLVVRDNGTGIAPEVMGKIFDPFFTTKDVGQGMGLGLSICYRIVQDYGGRIGATSQPGEFCEFTLEFPLLKPQTALQP